MAKPLVISVSRSAAAIVLLLTATFFAGNVMLPGLLGLDLDCAEGSSSRKARIVEMFGCAVAAGPKGWLYLAWFFAPIVLLQRWLRTMLRRAATPGLDEDRKRRP